MRRKECIAEKLRIRAEAVLLAQCQPEKVLAAPLAIQSLEHEVSNLKSQLQLREKQLELRDMQIDRLEAEKKALEEENRFINEWTKKSVWG